MKLLFSIGGILSLAFVVLALFKLRSIALVQADVATCIWAFASALALSFGLYAFALRTRIEALQATRALSTAAQTNLDAASAAYRNGVGSITDLNLAQQQVLAATNATTDAYSEILTAAATLALATGALGGAPE